MWDRIRKSGEGEIKKGKRVQDGRYLMGRVEKEGQVQSVN